MTIGIIGEGKMGSGIFHYLMDFGYPLRWLVSPEADPDQLQKHPEKRIRRAVRAGIISASDGDARLESMMIGYDFSILHDCHLIIEAIPEDTDRKQTLFRSLGSFLREDCIMGTNSSSIPPSALWFDPERDPYILGIHFFYPVSFKNTVEIMTTGKNTPEVIQRTTDFIQDIQKNPLVLDPDNGFILNRLFLEVQNEGWHLIEQGSVTPAQLDQLVAARLFPFGLFDFMDQVGIDTMKTSVERYISDYPHRDYYEGLLNKLIRLEKAGHLGKKSGQGFYSWRLPDSPGGTLNRHPGIIEKNGADQTKTASIPKEVQEEILNHLYHTWINAARRFTMQSGCTIEEMNTAIKDYFDLEEGPFDR